MRRFSQCFVRTGAMKARLQELLEDAAQSSGNSELLRHPVDGSDGVSSQLYNDLKDRQFREKYRSQISANKVNSAEAREIALSTPWSGNESPNQLNARLALDKYNVKAHTQKNVKPTISPSVSIKDKIYNAKEKSLDYTLSKNSAPSFEEEADFAQRYKERLLGPEVFGGGAGSAGNLINSLANQKIEEAERRGDFKNLPRGKPLNRLNSAQTPYLDHTSYYMNDVLKRQSALPPWIEKQGSVLGEIEKFRSDLDDAWRKRAVHLIREKLPDKIQLDTFQDTWWEQTQMKYLCEKVRFLNNSLRGYNLQAPLSSQKLYLLPENELKRCYKRVAPTLSKAVKEVPKKAIPEHTANHSPAESLGSLFWGMFKR